MTYGAMRMRLSKLLPGVDIDLIDGWIQDGYTSILQRIEWKRTEFVQTIQAPISYKTGTVTLTQGSATVAGVGTTFTAAMNGFMFRANNDDSYYQFSQTSATAATLDRPYEGQSGTYTYRIDQNLFVMSPQARIIRGVKPLQETFRDLIRATPAELDSISKSRNNYGTPRYYCDSWDNFSDPPCLQVELFPIPDSPDSSSRIPSFGVDVVLDQTALDPEETSRSLLVWLQPSALLEWVQAAADRFRASVMPEKAGAYLSAAQAHDKASLEAVGIMAQVNARQRGPVALKMEEKYRRPNRPSFPRNHHYSAEELD